MHKPIVRLPIIFAVAIVLGTTTVAPNRGCRRRCYPQTEVTAEQKSRPLFEAAAAAVVHSITQSGSNSRAVSTPRIRINDTDEKTEGGILFPQLLKQRIKFIRSMRGLIEFSDSKHLILKDDDIVGILETDYIKDLKLSNHRGLR
ncbi:hypothetical protein K1719_045941 [Acacia pycnantha]|nr:hypothetical protein K1719_045941 [Acacia pycnantha]